VDDVLGTDEICSVTYKGLAADVHEGARILIDDGLIGLSVKAVKGSEIYCRVDNGGPVKDHKSINVPGVRVNLPAITERDKADIEFGIEQGIDFVAASFVRKASDVREMRWLLDDRGAKHVKIIAKIENKEGVDNIEEIIEAADLIMVARGDLGVEISPEKLPLIQKKIIRLCNLAGKPVITATQMLDSMIRNPRPTRAEVTDVANAIFDGTDVIMLSGETASGKYPVETVQQMVKIAQTTESAIDYEKNLNDRGSMKNSSITNSIGHSTCISAQDLKAKAILTPTSTGYTAQVVSKFRPKSPILAFTYSDQVARHLSLVFGVTPIVNKHNTTAHEIFSEAISASEELGYISKGDLIVITAGAPVGVGGTTNMLRIHVVGNEI
jgi:pyruvate kinase